jgi:hypothetical protein
MVENRLAVGALPPRDSVTDDIIRIVQDSCQPAFQLSISCRCIPPAERRRRSCVSEHARTRRWSRGQRRGAECRTIDSRQLNRTTAACSTWATAIRCIGSAAGTPPANPHSICTAAPVQAPRRASDASSIRMPIGSYSSTSVDPDAAGRSPARRRDREGPPRG